MKENGFTVNPLKCECAVKETDWLGYWLTLTGLKPWKKKVDAILQLDRPKNLNHLRASLGAVNYYRDIWPRIAYIIKLLIDKSSTNTYVCTDDMEKAFKEMKILMAMDCLRQYPNHNLVFDIYTDAKAYQMGAYIMQNGKPVAYWSIKLNSAQINYRTMEKELLFIVCCLK